MSCILLWSGYLPLLVPLEHLYYSPWGCKFTAQPAAATSLQHAPVSTRKHRDTLWWTAELLVTGKCELGQILEEDMPQEGTSSTGPTEPQKKTANNCFQCLNILHCGRYCTCVVMYVVFWTTKTAGAHPLSAQSLVRMKGWSVVELPGHSLNLSVQSRGAPIHSSSLSLPSLVLLAVLPGAGILLETVQFATPSFSGTPEFKPEKAAFFSSPFFPNSCWEG